MERQPDPQAQTDHVEHVEPVPPSEAAADAPAAVPPILQSELAGPLETLLPGARRGDGESKHEAQVLRAQYNAFVEQHHDITAWSGVAAVGTIVAHEADSVVMHVGRHSYVKLDVERDLHGAVPEIGRRIEIESDGTYKDSTHGREQTLERGLQR